MAGFATLYIALNNPHSMVADEYYKQGLGINRSLAQDRRASELRLRAKIDFDQQSSTVTVLLNSAVTVENMQLIMLHPGSQKKDQTIVLQQTEVGQYRGVLARRYQYAYYLRLEPEDKSWRLNGEIDFQFGHKTALEAVP